MKRLFFMLLVPLLSLPLATNVMAANTPQSKNPAVVRHVFGVHGLACPFCAIGIKKTFKKIDGVQSVEVSLKHKQVTVFTNEGVCFSQKELKSLFEKTGFTYHGTIEQPKSCGKLS